MQAIIKGCQELKEIDLAHVDETNGLQPVDLAFLVRNISPNVEKLNLSSSAIKDEAVEILLRRCNKITALSLEATWITDDSLTNIRQHLNLTLEELSLVDDADAGAGEAFGYGVTFTGFLELKSMPSLKILNLYHEKDDCAMKLRQHLPHVKISSSLFHLWEMNNF